MHQFNMYTLHIYVCMCAYVLFNFRFLLRRVTYIQNQHNSNQVSLF